MTDVSVVLSLQNTVASYEQLQETPSQRDGISKDFEMDLRAFGCELIESAGILLKLPQVAISTAETLFHRFYYTSSLKKFGIRDMAMASIFLASKVEECPRRLNQIILAFHYSVSKAQGVVNYKTPENMFASVSLDMKEGMIMGEINILAKLGFNVRVEHPYGYMINYLQSLGLADDEEFSQMAWNYLNDSYRTNVSVCYQPWTIACAVIYLVARKRAVPLPRHPPWYTLFDADIEDMDNIAGHIMCLYQRPTVKNLPVTVSELNAYLDKLTSPKTSNGASVQPPQEARERDSPRQRPRSRSRERDSRSRRKSPPRKRSPDQSRRSDDRRDYNRDSDRRDYRRRDDYDRDYNRRSRSPRG
ncbi:hypothetical protein SmJEL517_g02009 [Synchytrium microbalum]|uniref:Cyclin-like domain-containing protein n=1 Tax=Synchytrium microbalum TaxID=1806994 RepID=A0A507C464_9FUNG|nr:uncharacterized protein SmJEL517_g02009 [Synchytrium microbalum]TPX35757.1 hypothetical protein SmJEL517_g02009 [Synchytrium microbalum]